MMSLLHEAIDSWSFVHLWGWAMVSFLAAWIRGRQGVLLVAVIAGICWEAVEYSWVESLLHFHEPLSNRLTDVLMDAGGAALGVYLAGFKPTPK